MYKCLPHKPHGCLNVALRPPYSVFIHTHPLIHTLCKHKVKFKKNLLDDGKLFLLIHILPVYYCFTSYLPKRIMLLKRVKPKHYFSTFKAHSDGQVMAFIHVIVDFALCS